MGWWRVKSDNGRRIEYEMKKKVTLQDGFFINGKKASHIDIIMKVGGEKYKQFMENEGHRYRKLKDRYLTEKLGEYLNAKQVRELTNIKTSHLVSLAKQGKLSAERLRGKWYYSVESLKNVIKNGLA